MPVPTSRRARTALSATLVAALLGGAVATYAATATVDPPPRTAFLARSDVPVDALAAGPIAGRAGAPLFVTSPTSLGEHAREGLIDADPELVILAGGTGALSAAVEAQVAAALPGVTVRRVSGATRSETARRFAELIDEYNPAFLPIDSTALLPDVILADDGAIAMPTGTTHCITEPYTPEVDRVAVAQVGLSGRRDVPGGSTLFARLLVSTDDGATWVQNSARISPEDQISNTDQGAITYTDVTALSAGTTYRFAVRAFGGLASARCNLVLTAAPGTGAQVTPDGADPVSTDEGNG
ncbi:cell wall-binding repeat-containing protein [Ornithinimicrobium sp. LYQ92]|uniref:cell wall-binding repeat-containing protein n=1 Tax=Serinicoccus sp. LYQ92 TaxID=3378798 RepID=UPI0038527F33